MNAQFGRRTQERIDEFDVVSYIESNYKRIDPHFGYTNIELFEHQKYLIKKILDGKTITTQGRQMGVTSLYSWFATAYCQLHDDSNILIITNKHIQFQSIARIIQTCNRNNKILTYIKSQNKIVFTNGSTIRFTSLYSIPDPLLYRNNDYVFIQANVYKVKNQDDIIEYVTNRNINNVNISFNAFKNGNEMCESKLHTLWRDALIQRNEYKAIYLPWYLHPKKLYHTNYYQEQKLAIGEINVSQELLV